MTPLGLEKFKIVGPIYEVIHWIDGTTLACERHADGTLAACKINDEPVTPKEYIDCRDAWKTR